jgi:hypothetical protein
MMVGEKAEDCYEGIRVAPRVLDDQRIKERQRRFCV